MSPPSQTHSHKPSTTITDLVAPSTTNATSTADQSKDHTRTSSTQSSMPDSDKDSSLLHVNPQLSELNLENNKTHLRQQSAAVNSVAADKSTSIASTSSFSNGPATKISSNVKSFWQQQQQQASSPQNSSIITKPAAAAPSTKRLMIRDPALQQQQQSNSHHQTTHSMHTSQSVAA
jgi:hypothetical protein